MNARRYVVPVALRSAMFVPGQAPGRRQPARVSAAAFTAAGLPVPEHPAQRNIYQLTGRQGLVWSPGLDARIRRRGGELLGHGRLILADIDCPAAVDGRPLVNAVLAVPGVQLPAARAAGLAIDLRQGRFQRRVQAGHVEILPPGEVTQLQLQLHPQGRQPLRHPLHTLPLTAPDTPPSAPSRGQRAATHRAAGQADRQAPSDARQARYAGRLAAARTLRRRWSPRPRPGPSRAAAAQECRFCAPQAASRHLCSTHRTAVMRASVQVQCRSPTVTDADQLCATERRLGAPLGQRRLRTPGAQTNRFETWWRQRGKGRGRMLFWLARRPIPGWHAPSSASFRALGPRVTAT
jgi:hypothetical protein